MSMSPQRKTSEEKLEYIRQFYGVPAFTGARIHYAGQPGAILSAQGAGPYLVVQLDGLPYTIQIHPTWQVAYTSPEGWEAERIRTLEESIAQAHGLILRAVELMDENQVGQWEGVRAWLELHPGPCQESEK